MTVVVLDQMRSVTAVDNGPTTQVTVSQAGMQGPQGNPTVVNGKSGGSITLNSSDVGAVALAVVGVANGVASLDSSSLVPIAQLPLSGLAGNFVDLATAQTVNGVKTFGSIPVGPASDPTTANQLARKSYVDQKLSLSGGTMTGALTLAADPSSNLQAATKQYVDAFVQGLSTKPSCVAATTGTLPANTYANGASGVGATLTGNVNGALAAQDGVTLTAGQNLLVKNEATAANNGIYVVTQVGTGSLPYILTRHVDMDATGEIAGAFTFVESGTINVGSGWVVASSPPITVGTGAINWTQFSGAGEITVGTGLVKSGNQLSLSTPVSVANGGTGSATQNFVDLTTNQSVAGAKTFASNVTINNWLGINGTSNPMVQTTTTTTGGQIYRAIGPDITTVAYEAQVSSDTIHRFAAYLDGTLQWGPGTSGRDTNLYRSAANTLATDDNLTVGMNLTVTGNLSVSGVGQQVFVIKTSNQTSVSASYASDTQLTIPLEANATYTFDAFIIYSTLAAAGINLRFSYSGTLSSGQWTTRAINGSSGTTSGTAPFRADSANIGTGNALQGGEGSTSANTIAATPIGTINTTTAGNLFFEWSQNAANATATTVYLNSWLRAQRVA